MFDVAIKIYDAVELITLRCQCDIFIVTGSEESDDIAFQFFVIIQSQGDSTKIIWLIEKFIPTESPCRISMMI